MKKEGKYNKPLNEKNNPIQPVPLHTPPSNETTLLDNFPFFFRCAYLWM